MKPSHSGARESSCCYLKDFCYVPPGKDSLPGLPSFRVDEAGEEGAKGIQEEPIGKCWQLCFLLQQLSCYHLPVGVETVPASGRMAPCRGCCCEVGHRGAGRIMGEPSLGSCQPLVSTADLEAAARRLPSGAAINGSLCQWAPWAAIPGKQGWRGR